MPTHEQYLKHKESNLARSKKWNQEHKEQHKISNLKYSKSQKGKAKVKMYQNQYNPFHKKEINERNRKYVRRLHDKVIDLLGGKCIRCGITDKRILQVNHMNGGGCKEFKRIGALVLYNQILKGKRVIDDLEVRCSNCNIIYKWEKSERKT